MQITKVITTPEQRSAAKDAAKKRYAHNLHTPDRPNWTGGKCPVSEYRAILGEIGAAIALESDWTDLVLFSTDPDDYTKPDIGDWEVKSGSTFNQKDLDKGAKYIIWVNPWTAFNYFDCGYETCATRMHQRQSGVVEIIGWTDLMDLYLCSDFGDYYKPAGKALRMPHTLPVVGT